MLARERKQPIRGDYRRTWMSDDYFDLIVWYERSNAIHGFQLCYGKPQYERALTWVAGRGFTHTAIDSGEQNPESNRTPVLIPDGSFPEDEVGREFCDRATSCRNRSEILWSRRSNNFTQNGKRSE